jgi:phage-related tail fiber protein
MEIDSPKVREGTGVTNLTAPSGANLPTIDISIGELFYKTGAGAGFYGADGSVFSRFIYESELSAHAGDAALHLTVGQNSFLDAITVSSAEVNYLSGVTSNVQTQLTGKLNLSGGTMTGALTLSADPTLALHAATKQYVDSLVGGGGTVTSVAATAPIAGLTVSGSPITGAGTLVFALANDLAALEGLSGNGIAVRSASDTWVQRSLIGTNDQISVQDGNGVGGNPTLSIADNPILPGTGAVTVPIGTAAQQPGSPVNGMIRYNSTDDKFEVREAGAWAPVTGGGILEQYTATATASQTVVNLPWSYSTGANQILVWIEGVKQVTSVDFTETSSTSITFGTGLALGDRIEVIKHVKSNVVTLPDVGTPGTYTQVTTDSKGRVTSGANPTTLAGYGITDAAPISHVSDETIHLTSGQNTWIDAITATSAEVNYLSGVTSSIQTQLNNKQAILGYTAEDAANKNAVNGYAGLDGSGKISSSQLPSIAITDTFVVASQVAMLALTAQTGDVAVRTDENKSYILQGTDPTNLAHWQELLTPTDSVASVNGMTGVVTISTITGNAGSATILQTGRTIGMTGDVTWTSASFDGSGNVTGSSTLANSGVSPGTYTSVTVDAKGRVTSGSNPGGGTFADGTAGSPSITFTADTDTGFYRQAANTIGVAAGGIEIGRLYNNGGYGQFLVNDTNPNPSRPIYSAVGFGTTGFHIGSATYAGISIQGTMRLTVDNTGAGVNGTLSCNAFTGGEISMKPGISNPAYGVTIEAGENSASGNTSGTVSIKGGSGATWNAHGGSVLLRGGVAGATNRNSGDVNIETPVPTGSGNAGNIYIRTNNVLRFRINESGALGVGVGASYGSTGQVLTSQGTNSIPIWSTISSTPAGSNTEIQYNNAGAFGASSYHAWNNTTRVLTVAGPDSTTATIENLTGDQRHLLIKAGTAGASMNGGNLSLQATAGLAGSNGGNVLITAGDATLAVANVGKIVLQAGLAPSGSSTGYIQLATSAANASVSRLVINQNGSWSLGNPGAGTGTAGQYFQSAGSGSPPTWQSFPTTVAGYGITDVYTKTEVDSLITGLDFKASVRVATTAPITLSGTQTIDGVSVIAGDRVLVKDQGTASENGIYVCAAGSWSRSTDADVSAEVTTGMYVFVSEGTSNADSGWVLSTNDAITLGTTGLTFVQFNGLGQITAGAGLTKTGNQLDIVTASSSRIVVNANDIDLATTGVGAGTYNSLTVDVYGRVTAGSNPTTLAGYGITDAQGLDTTLTALAAFNTNGLMVQTAADTFNARTLTGTANRITITNGDGVSGNPVFDIGTDVVTLTGTQTLTNKTMTNADNTAQTLTDAATISWDMNSGGIATVTLGGNRTMAAPTNLKKGTYILKVIQDGTGSRTLAWNAVFKWASGTAPTLSTAAGTVDILTFVCDGTNMYGSIVKAFS